MLGPLLFVKKGVLSNIFFYKKKLYIKKIPKKSFSQKKFLLDVNLKNVVKQKRCIKAILVGAEKNSTWKKSKLKVWHAYRKQSLNHTSETEKSVFYFFNFVFWEVFLHAVSIPSANFSLVWPNFCTPYCPLF